MMTNSFPRLDDRARGWLRFIWDKATTQDDWSVNGEPHPWWPMLRRRGVSATQLSPTSSFSDIQHFRP